MSLSYHIDDEYETYSEYIAKKLEENKQYSEYIEENIEENKQYSEYLADQIDKHIKYSEYLNENTKHFETEEEKLKREQQEIRDLRERKLKRIFKKKRNTI